MLFGEDISAVSQALRVPWCSVPMCLCLEGILVQGENPVGSACSAVGLAPPQSISMGFQSSAPLIGVLHFHMPHLPWLSLQFKVPCGGLSKTM